MMQMQQRPANHSHLHRLQQSCTSTSYSTSPQVSLRPTITRSHSHNQQSPAVLPDSGHSICSRRLQRCRQPLHSSSPRILLRRSSVCAAAAVAGNTVFQDASQGIPPWQEDESEVQMQAPAQRQQVAMPFAPYVRPLEQTCTPPSIRETGTLRPAAEWFPVWMRYRRREDNYVFWQDKFVRCSLDIPWIEKRWTVFSSVWFLVMETKFFGVPPALRYLWYLAWRNIMMKVYDAHKQIVLWQCKLDVHLAHLRYAQYLAMENTTSSSDGGSSTTPMPAATPSASASAGAEPLSPTVASAVSPAATATSVAANQVITAPAAASSSASNPFSALSDAVTSGFKRFVTPVELPPGVPRLTFSRTMALRRLHWKNTLLAELLYLLNLYKTARIHLLPPVKRPFQRPTFFFLF